MTTPRDSRGRSLTDYPRPSVAVDTAVLTLDDAGELAVLLTLVDDRPRLPGTFLHPGETLERAALRALRDKARIRGLAPRQLHVFDDPDRDDRGWVLSVAHYDVVPMRDLLDDAVVLPTAELPSLPFDHAQIVDFAVEAVRGEYADAPDPRGLVGETFTMRDLRRVHEGIAGRRLQPDTFRRAMLPHLEATGEFSQPERGRPAELYRQAG